MCRKIFACFLIVFLTACLVFSVSAREQYPVDAREYDTVESFDVGKSLLISFGTGLVIGLITVGVMYGQLKTVRGQHTAGQYTKPGSMQVTGATDTYLYRNVTRVPIPKQNSNHK